MLGCTTVVHSQAQQEPRSRCFRSLAFSPLLRPPASGSPWRRSMSVVAPLNLAVGGGWGGLGWQGGWWCSDGFHRAALSTPVRGSTIPMPGYLHALDARALNCLSGGEGGKCGRREIVGQACDSDRW